MAAGGLAGSGGVRLVTVSILFQILAALAVGMRIWAKQKRGRNLRPHDYLIFAALFFDIAFTAVICVVVVDGGVGLHLPVVLATLGMPTLTVALKGFLASTFVWMAATTCAKCSVLTLYIDIFEKRSFRLVSYVIGSISVLYCLAYYLTNLLDCRPFAYNWDKTIPGGRCTNTTVNEIVSATINMALDLSIVVLPTPFLWRLQMSARKKAALSAVMSLGLVICAMNIARIYFEATADEEDVTFSLVNAGLYAALEVDFGIICACMTTFGPLLFREGFATQIRAHAGPDARSGGLFDAERTREVVLNSASKGSVARSHAMDDDDVLLNDLAFRKATQGLSSV